MITEPFIFPIPLTEGIIIKRKSQFTMLVDIDGIEYNCHCPNTGRIGNIELGNRPCLLSKSVDLSRKTPYIVEAISLNRQRDISKKWIGINQNAANRYVEHYLANGGFADIVGTEKEVYREQFLGVSKLDFLVGDIYLEVKTPLQQLQIEIPDYIKIKKVTPFSSTDRFVKHITELGNSLKEHQRAILLTCFLYDNPKFKIIHQSTNYEMVSNVVAESINKGVEIWQANFEVTPLSVTLKRYFRLDL